MYEYKGDGNKIGIWCEDHICHDNSMYDATRYGQRVLVNIGGLGGYILCHAHINNYIHYTLWDVITETKLLILFVNIITNWSFFALLNDDIPPPFPQDIMDVTVRNRTSTDMTKYRPSW